MKIDKRKLFSPSGFSLRKGGIHDEYGTRVSLIDLVSKKNPRSVSVIEAAIRVEYKDKTWDFNLLPSDVREFDDLAIQYRATVNNPSSFLDSELIFSIFPKNDMLK